MTELEKQLYNRSELLLGAEKMTRLGETRVILIGTGGVGSWCAESLVRSGVRHLTLVDSDKVCLTNCNRQLMATPRTVGRIKVDALRERLLEINPNADITALRKVYSAENAESFDLASYHFIIDAIDSLQEKVHLIQHATRLVKECGDITFLSSMGAALRVDPTRVRVDEFWNIQGDPLARALRERIRKSGIFPASKFLCVYSQEPPLPNVGSPAPANDEGAPQEQWGARKARINGSLSHITGIFGLTLAGLVIQKR